MGRSRTPGSARARLSIALTATAMLLAGCTSGADQAVTVTSNVFATAAVADTPAGSPIDTPASTPPESTPPGDPTASQADPSSQVVSSTSPATLSAASADPSAAAPSTAIGASSAPPTGAMQPEWPTTGAAAYHLAGGPVTAHNDTRPRPIASVAKVMTAYLVLTAHPLAAGQSGPSITITAADVADTARREKLDQSLVPVAAGEVLTERQALAALLLPSANNIAAVLAAWVAGSQAAFVAGMNSTAAKLGMAHTRYTDPSGYDDATVSTATDQLLLADKAMDIDAFAAIVALGSIKLPVAGVVHNTNRLIGVDGFVGVKTGSDDAAGGCLAFRTVKTVRGSKVVLTGVVLGQPGPDLLGSVSTVVRALADSVTTGS